jgi:hypothetical protein
VDRHTYETLQKGVLLTVLSDFSIYKINIWGKWNEFGPRMQLDAAFDETLMGTFSEQFMPYCAPNPSFRSGGYPQ